MVGQSRTTTAVGASVGIAGVVLAVFQVLESSLGDFHPRPVVKLLIAVTVFVFGLALSRLRTLAARRQARAERDLQLDEDLAVWPLETVSEVDPYYLGVFPLPSERDEERALGEYVPRDADAAIEEAMRAEPFVLVFGPARAGKSRTAYEAARRALPDAWLIVPEGPDELRTLMNVDPPLDFGSYVGVIWLDDLDRFVPSLDIDLMDALGGTRQRLKMVATIREDAYEAMLEAGGQEGETARRVLTRARGLQLPAKLSAREEKEAAGVLPGRRRGSPLGAGTGELLDGGHTPADRPRGRSSVTLVTTAVPAAAESRWERRLPGPIRDDIRNRRERHAGERAAREATRKRREALRRRGIEEGTDILPRQFTFDVPLALVAMLFALSGAALGAAIADRFVDREPMAPPPLSVQLQRVQDDGPGTPSTHPVFLRGAEQKSYLISYQPGPLSESDEVRVYDVDGDVLDGQPEFHFRPAPGPGSGWTFFLRNTKVDIDHDGASDVVGAFRPAGPAKTTFLPVVIFWRSAMKRSPGSRYTIKALVKSPTRLGWEPLADPAGTTHLVRAGAVTDFAVLSINDTVKLLLGTRVGPGSGGKLTSRIRLDAELLGARRGRPDIGLRCTPLDALGHKVSVTFDSKPGPLAPQLVAKWRNYDATASCGSR